MRLLKDSVESGVNNEGSNFYEFDVVEDSRTYHMIMRKYSTSSKIYFYFETSSRSHVSKGRMTGRGSYIDRVTMINYSGKSSIQFHYDPLLVRSQYNNRHRFSVSFGIEVLKTWMYHRKNICMVRNDDQIVCDVDLFRRVDPIDVSPTGYLAASLVSTNK